ncbi:MAG TPA: hypothetical protein VGB77_07870 [Abditibacteriaceae bacterium]
MLRHLSNPPNIGDVLQARDVSRQIADWLFDCQFQQHSRRTIEFRKHVGEKLVWFLEREAHNQCGASELRRFLAHVTDGHLEPEGRWRNPKMKRPTRPATVHRYFRKLRTFCA